MNSEHFNHGLLGLALRLHSWGANVTAIKAGTKNPCHQWKHWAEIPQSRDEVSGLPWDHATGVGVISGVGGWRAFDVDDCRDDGHQTVWTMLAHLGLSDDYDWVWRTGSGKGLAIIFRCSDELPAAALSKNKVEKGVFWGVSNDGDFDHLELRWAKCQTLLPPSEHPTGPGYRWRNETPAAPPAEVTVDRVIAAFMAVATPKETKGEEIGARNWNRQPSLKEDDLLKAICARFDMVAFAQERFGGEVVQEGEEVRVTGNGGLLINPEKSYNISQV